MAQKEKDILELLAEAPLAEISQSFSDDGDYAPPPEGVVGENEIIIGEFTDFEKSAWTIMHLLAEKADAIADSNNDMVDEAGPGELDDLKVHLNKVAYEAVTALANGVNSLLWYYVKKRLGVSTMGVGGIGIREGYKIVSFPQDPVRALHELLK